MQSRRRPNERRGRFSPPPRRRYKDMKSREKDAAAESSFISETRNIYRHLSNLRKVFVVTVEHTKRRLYIP
jgi:hypothetical protein